MVGFRGLEDWKFLLARDRTKTSRTAFRATKASARRAVLLLSAALSAEFYYDAVLVVVLFFFAL
jgi:hypothetical protein